MHPLGATRANPRRWSRKLAGRPRPRPTKGIQADRNSQDERCPHRQATALRRSAPSRSQARRHRNESPRCTSHNAPALGSLERLAAIRRGVSPALFRPQDHIARARALSFLGFPLRQSAPLICRRLPSLFPPLWEAPNPRCLRRLPAPHYRHVRIQKVAEPSPRAQASASGDRGTNLSHQSLVPCATIQGGESVNTKPARNAQGAFWATQTRPPGLRLAYGAFNGPLMAFLKVVTPPFTPQPSLT
jgi:hypothetical protein